MDSRELGLLLARQLFNLDDLHFGMWDEGLEVRLSNIPLAQQRFSDYLIDKIPSLGEGGSLRVLDVGCGTGQLLCRLLERGHRADGVSPSHTLNRVILERLKGMATVGHEPRLFPCRFEDLDTSSLTGLYDVVLFSESFQFIKIHRALEKLGDLLKPNGLVLICDTFSLTGPQQDPIRSGHGLEKFFRLIDGSPFMQVADEDITQRVSPTIALLEDVMQNRVKPALDSTHHYLRGKHPVVTRLAKALWGRRFRRACDRHCGGDYTQQTFEATKSYRFFAYTLGPGKGAGRVATS